MKALFFERTERTEGESTAAAFAKSIYRFLSPLGRCHHERSSRASTIRAGTVEPAAMDPRSSSNKTHARDQVRQSGVVDKRKTIESRRVVRRRAVARRG